MHDYYLGTSDEQSMWDALVSLDLAEPAEAVLDEQGGVLRPTGFTPKGIALDVIGTWYESAGTEEEPELTAIPGWHFNVRSPFPIDWPEGITSDDPVTPWRVWG